MIEALLMLLQANESSHLMIQSLGTDAELELRLERTTLTSASKGTNAAFCSSCSELLEANSNNRSLPTILNPHSREVRCRELELSNSNFTALKLHGNTLNQRRRSHFLSSGPG